MSSIVSKVGNAIFKNSGIGESLSNKVLAEKITTALTTTVENGFNKQIAIIEVVDLMKELNNPYSFMDKGSLDWGIGEQTLTMRFKSSKKSSTEIDDWLPSGNVNGLERVQSTSTGSIQRVVDNSYSEFDMREFVRDGNAFSSLLQLESSAGAKAKQREHRELPRYLFGMNVSDELLPADYKTAVTTIKELVNQNRINVSATTDYKSIVNYLKEFSDKYYNNYSDEFNAGRNPAQTGNNLWIGGVDTGVKAMMNSAKKESTVIVMSTKFRNRLEQELGNVFNPAYWQDFTNKFGIVVEDTFEDDSIMYIFDKETIATRSVFNEFTNTYYPKKSAFETITKWKDYYRVNPLMNLVSFKFAKTKKVEKISKEVDSERKKGK